jgi:putative DNA primase/helicase
MRWADPNDGITKVTGIAPDWNCPTPLWTGFLDTVTDSNAELINYLQRITGYSLTGSTEEQALFFLYGTGANGKSTFINAVTACIGDYHKTAPIETFTSSKNDRHPTELAGLTGARLVTSVETEEGRHWDEVKVKTLTGGDIVSARFMRGDFFEYTPRFKLLIAGNHKPSLRSVDEAIRRRFNLIPFTTTIPPEKRDRDFPEKLKAELPGIMAWIVDGCMAWRQDGLQRPDVVASATETYLQSEDATLAWIEDRCVRDVDSFTTTSALFSSWSDWASKNGEPVGTMKALQAKVESKGFSPWRKENGRGFAGLRISQASW